jgi:hypothetical protein
MSEQFIILYVLTSTFVMRDDLLYLSFSGRSDIFICDRPVLCLIFLFLSNLSFILVDACKEKYCLRKTKKAQQTHIVVFKL